MIHFALIGCGRIAQRHAEHINKFGKLIAVCDNVKEKADALATQYNARAYYNAADLLANEKILMWFLFVLQMDYTQHILFRL